MIISIDIKKALIKFNTNSLTNIGTERYFLKVIKYIYHSPKAMTVFNEKILEIFLLRSGTMKGCPLYPLLFNTVLEVWAKAIRWDKLLTGVIMVKK